ncbi:hypothetical protein FM109_03250 [Vibrio casei]|nr:hypothetical protein FM109_03250 [Vibrio casei]
MWLFYSGNYLGELFRYERLMTIQIIFLKKSNKMFPYGNN